MQTSIWDSHIHLFPPRLFNAIWRWFHTAGWDILYSDYSESEMVAFLKNMGVEKAFLLTYAHKPNISMELNRWVKDFSDTYPLFIPFGCLHPEDDNLLTMLSTVLDQWKFAGLKLQLAVQGFPADDVRLDPVYDAVARRDKVMIVHTGTAPYSTEDYPFLGLERIRPVLERYPRMKTIVPHLGLFEFDTALDMLAQYPNLYLDTAWVLGNSAVPLDINKLTDAIATYPDRFIYGSDFPIMEHDPQQAVDAIRSLNIDDKLVEAMLRTNAMKLLGAG